MVDLADQEGRAQRGIMWIEEKKSQMFGVPECAFIPTGLAKDIFEEQ